jgi:tetratricopeptide (TPR) repeat protein/transcriptional regulator with XRE-family HTH domain
MGSPDSVRGELGMLLRRHRMAAGLTQEELAERSGLSVRAISNIERGRTAGPYSRSVRMLAQALKLPDQVREELQQAARPKQNGQQPDQTASPYGYREPVSQPVMVPHWPVPRQLPPAIGHFVGRAAELVALTGRLAEIDGTDRASVISVISGTPGAGKTALAVRWAHRVADRFPGGQICIDLHGYDAREPVTAADALACLLRALGVRDRDLPPTGEERAAAFRTALAGRRVLLLLDNAASAEQVRPLLPGDPASVTIITSRDSMVGLVARNGATRVQLDALTAAESVELLRALIGERVDAEHAAAAMLAAQCCGLPLALRITAELAASRSGSSLADLAAELADEQSRLDLLDAGADPGTSVRAVFSWSYQHLGPDAARVFRLIALHPGSDIDSYGAAALTGLTVDRSRQILHRLEQAHLLQPARPGRYFMHDLVRAYARELAAAQDSADERGTAVTRLVGYYLGAAGAAMDALYPAERHRRPAITTSAPSIPPIRGDPAAARGWADQERAALVEITRTAMDHGLYLQVAWLSAILFRYLDAGGYYQEAAVIHDCARQAAAATGDFAAEADALISLGLAETWQGRYQEATGHLNSALLLCERTGELRGQSRALHNLGLGSIQHGHYEEAAGYYTRALALYSRQGDWTGEARALCNLALIDARQGRYEQAIGRYQQALELSRQIGDRNGEAHQLGGIADIQQRLGRYGEAATTFDQAIALYRQTGDRQGEARTLADRCQVALRQGNNALAADLGRQAVSLSQDIDDRSGLAGALSALGDSLLATGQPDQASAEYLAALHTATAVGDKLEQARAHHGLARSYHAAGKADQAGEHLQAALTQYTDLDAPEADQILTQIATDTAYSVT